MDVSHLTPAEQALWEQKMQSFGSARTNKHAYGEPSFWLKWMEVESAKRGHLTVILRLGDRSDPEKMPNQWLPLGLPVPLYFIAVPGDQAAGIEAKFEHDAGFTVKITGRKVTCLGDIGRYDLLYQGGSAVPTRPEEVEPFLRWMFGSGKYLSPDQVVTLYFVEYLPRQQPASD